MTQFVLPDDYYIFGPSTNFENPAFVTETERSVEMKYQMHKIMHKMLTKVGKIGGTALHTGPISKDQWCHLTRDLSRIEPSLTPRASDISQTETSQPILHGNLHLETKVLPTTITTITAKTPPQFRAIRIFLSNSIGVGIRKRAPNKTDCKAGRRIFTLQTADVVNLVDIDLAGLEEDAEGGNWFPDDVVQLNQYFQKQRNYIKFRYDKRLREFRVTVKCMSVVCGAIDAEPIAAFLLANGINWGGDDDDDGNDSERDDNADLFQDLRIRRGIIIDNIMWMISSVNIGDNRVVLVRPNAGVDGKTRVVALDVAREHVI